MREEVCSLLHRSVNKRLYKASLIYSHWAICTLYVSNSIAVHDLLRGTGDSPRSDGSSIFLSFRNNRQACTPNASWEIILKWKPVIAPDYKPISWFLMCEWFNLILTRVLRIEQHFFKMLFPRGKVPSSKTNRHLTNHCPASTFIKNYLLRRRLLFTILLSTY